MQTNIQDDKGSVECYYTEDYHIRYKDEVLCGAVYKPYVKRDLKFAKLRDGGACECPECLGIWKLIKEL